MIKVKNFIATFKRYEKKYMLNEELTDKLMPIIEENMLPDAYGKYDLSSVYFDTDDFALVRNSIEKPVYKEKMRLRSYGIPTENDTVFLELKKKYNDVVYKRRADMKLCEAFEYLKTGKYPESADKQIMNEIDWFIKFYSPSPKAFIAYSRTAFFGKDDPNFRLTFDRNIRWRGTQLDPSKGDWGTLLIPKECVLMEVKISGAMPMWLSRALSELKIFPTSFSKYGTCYKDNLLYSDFLPNTASNITEIA